MTTFRPLDLRAGAGAAATLERLGPLANLVGTWLGTGFSLIALPVFGGAPFRLQVNATTEAFTFTPISAPIPDRGSVQPDIFYTGLTYVQNVADSVTRAALHVENGMWLNVPATSDPKSAATVVRQSVVPHGDSLLAQGNPLTVHGGPAIAPVSPLPTGPGVDEKYTAPYRTGPFPPGFNPQNPNAALQAAIEGQKITQTIVLPVSTAPSGGILNIPFVTANANASQLDAIFWIETVHEPSGATFVQLQYTQTIILNFEGIQWPHITLATLIKQ